METRPQPEAKTPLIPGPAIGTGGGSEPGGPARARGYPRPPALLPRLIMLCLRPESWAETARYPTYVTILPLLMAIVLAGLAVGIGESTRMMAGLRLFVASYDSIQYPPLEISSDGTLKALGPLNQPIEFEQGTVHVLVDPTGKTTPDSVKNPGTFLITDKEIFVCGLNGATSVGKIAQLLPTVLPAVGSKFVINGQSLSAYFREQGSNWAIFCGVLFFIAQVLGDSLWVILIILLVTPLIMLSAASVNRGGAASAKRFVMPRRAAYRMAAGIMVPLILLGGVLTALGHPVSLMLGVGGGHIFWYLAAMALSIWTGIMANRMYAPRDPRRRGS